MDAGPIVAAVGVLTTATTWFLGQRRGAQTERRNAERHHEDLRPRMDVRAVAKGHPRLELEHQAGPAVDEIVLEVLDPLPGTIGAGLLMETARGASVRSLMLHERMIPGDVQAARVALDSERRGSELRLRITYRARPQRRRWSLRSPQVTEWVDATTVTYPRPARVSSAVGIRLPNQADIEARRRRG
jgi:hypothetical protein